MWCVAGAQLVFIECYTSCEALGRVPVLAKPGFPRTQYCLCLRGLLRDEGTHRHKAGTHSALPQCVTLLQRIVKTGTDTSDYRGSVGDKTRGLQK